VTIPDDLKKLAAIDGPCLSVFQPLLTKSETRLNAAAQKADVLLTEKGFNAADREEFLRPIFKIAENTDWSGRTGSMVVFRAPGFTQASFWPDTLKPQVHLTDEFFILPLLAGVAAQRNFWILTLSLHKIRLFRGTLQGLSEVVLPKELPRNLADAGGFDKPDHDLESQPAPYLHDFFKMVDRAIQPILAGSADPLILAAVEREIALYREVNTYAALSEQTIHGSPESLGEPRLHKAALELIAANPENAIEKVRREMDAAAGRGLLVTDLGAIHEAAGIGQVERLFFDANPRADENLINATALAVIHNSGTVICSEALGGSGVAAILRYRVAALAASRI
jgi:hypothetical protein